VGAIGTLLARSLQLGLSQQSGYLPGIRGDELLFFGALYTLTGGWSRETVRDRKTRFRIMPIVWTGLLSAVLTPLFWPYANNEGVAELRYDGIALAVLIATAVQLISPWDKAAALYAQYVRASAKQKGKGRAVRC
jgi:hypothetical protein